MQAEFLLVLNVLISQSRSVSRAMFYCILELLGFALNALGLVFSRYCIFHSQSKPLMRSFFWYLRIVWICFFQRCIALSRSLVGLLLRVVCEQNCSFSVFDLTWKLFWISFFEMQISHWCDAVSGTLNFIVVRTLLWSATAPPSSLCSSLYPWVPGQYCIGCVWVTLPFVIVPVYLLL